MGDDGLSRLRQSKSRLELLVSYSSLYSKLERRHRNILYSGVEHRVERDSSSGLSRMVTPAWQREHAARFPSDHETSVRQVSRNCVVVGELARVVTQRNNAI